jgi:hypothetical protein
VPSSLPEAKYLLSDENETDLTTILCPIRVVISFFNSTFQIFIFPSLLPEAKYLPSGENAMERIYP